MFSSHVCWKFFRMFCYLVSISTHPHPRIVLSLTMSSTLQGDYPDTIARCFSRINIYQWLLSAPHEALGSLSEWSVHQDDLARRQLTSVSWWSQNPFPLQLLTLPAHCTTCSVTSEPAAIPRYLTFGTWPRT